MRLFSAVSADPLPRFVADKMLGRLARWLRILGCDVLYGTNFSGRGLLAAARSEDRVMLTRDRGVLRGGDLPRHLFVESDHVREQLQVVMVTRSRCSPTASASSCKAMRLPECTRQGLRTRPAGRRAAAAAAGLGFRRPPSPETQPDSRRCVRVSSSLYWSRRTARRARERIDRMGLGGAGGERVEHHVVAHDRRRRRFRRGPMWVLRARGADVSGRRSGGARGTPLHSLRRTRERRAPRGGCGGFRRARLRRGYRRGARRRLHQLRDGRLRDSRRDGEEGRGMTMQTRLVMAATLLLRGCSPVAGTSSRGRSGRDREGRRGREGRRPSNRLAIHSAPVSTTATSWCPRLQSLVAVFDDELQGPLHRLQQGRHGPELHLQQQPRRFERRRGPVRGHDERQHARRQPVALEHLLDLRDGLVVEAREEAPRGGRACPRRTSCAGTRPRPGQRQTLEFGHGVGRRARVAPRRGDPCSRRT